MIRLDVLSERKTQIHSTAKEADLDSTHITLIHLAASDLESYRDCSVISDHATFDESTLRNLSNVFRPAGPLRLLPPDAQGSRPKSDGATIPQTGNKRQRRSIVTHSVPCGLL